MDELGHFSGYGGRTQTPLVADDLVIISFISVAGVRYSCDGVDYGREVFCSYPDGILVVRLTASRPSVEGEPRLVTMRADAGRSHFHIS